MSILRKAVANKIADATGVALNDAQVKDFLADLCASDISLHLTQEVFPNALRLTYDKRSMFVVDTLVAFTEIFDGDIVTLKDFYQADVCIAATPTSEGCNVRVEYFIEALFALAANLDDKYRDAKLERGIESE
jgi:hypothetical protein